MAHIKKKKSSNLPDVAGVMAFLHHVANLWAQFGGKAAVELEVVHVPLAQDLAEQISLRLEHVECVDVREVVLVVRTGIEGDNL